MFKLRFTNSEQKGVWLVEPKVTLGSADDNDLVLSADTFAPYHAEIRVNHNLMMFRLLHDSSSTYVNDQFVKPLINVQLQPGDRVSLCDLTLEVVDTKLENKAMSAIKNEKALTGWSLLGTNSDFESLSFGVDKHTLIGRASDCEITLAAAQLSRHHAQLNLNSGVLSVKDLDSSNGTFVNDVRVSESLVKHGDELRFGALSFSVIGPFADTDKTTVRVLDKQHSHVAASLSRRPKGTLSSSRLKHPTTQNTLANQYSATGHSMSTHSTGGRHGIVIAVLLGFIIVLAVAYLSVWG